MVPADSQRRQSVRMRPVCSLQAANEVNATDGRERLLGCHDETIQTLRVANHEHTSAWLTQNPLIDC